MNNEIGNLKGIVIDAGHGGADSGAVGNGMLEKDYTLLISKYLYDRFNELGLPVKLTRDSDETISPSERVKRIKNAFGDTSNVLVISNHLNAGGADGAETIYALRNKDTLPKLILEKLENSGQNIRRAYQRKLPRDPSKDYYFIHRETGKTMPIIIEYGFIDSKGDDAIQIKNNYEKYAEAVVKAITEYLNVPYSKPTEQEIITGGNYYIVKQGDTLYSIANKFNTSVNDLKTLNGLKSNIIEVNKKLLIPTLINNKTYIVKKGDTLYSISQKNNISVDEIKKLNNLKSNILSIDQILILNDNVTNNQTYVVKSGDSLYSIAKRFNTTVNELKSLNNLATNLLSINQILTIPN